MKRSCTECAGRNAVEKHGGGKGDGARENALLPELLILKFWGSVLLTKKKKIFLWTRIGDELLLEVTMLSFQKGRIQIERKGLRATNLH
jgi:hypothetical protein